MISLEVGIEARSAFLSGGVVLLSSLGMILFRQKLFTLPASELWFIAMIHAARTVVALLLGALLWHIVLPQISLEIWLELSALRMLVSRLPFVPNNDILFAGLAALLLGHEPKIGALMAMMAAMTLAAHLVVGASFATLDVLSGKLR
jgi:hypothetical protein